MPLQLFGITSNLCEALCTSVRPNEQATGECVHYARLRGLIRHRDDAKPRTALGGFVSGIRLPIRVQAHCFRTGSCHNLTVQSDF